MFRQVLKHSHKTFVSISSTTQQPCLGLSGVSSRNNQIDTIKSWGPLFRLSLDLFINNHTGKDWSNVLAFRLNSVTGYRIPSLDVGGSGTFQFANRVSKGERRFSWPFELNKWYSIVMEQKKVSGKVRMLEISNETPFYFSISTPSQLTDKRFTVWRILSPGHSKM